jgi:hypothetical protein
MDKKDLNIDKNGTPFKGNKKAAAGQKWVAQKIGKSFWVTVSSEGFLYNPLDLSDSLSKIDKERGKPFYNMQKCGQVCFDAYVHFLRSKNRTNLVIAQRAFQNGS